MKLNWTEKANELSKALGYQFKDIDLLQRSLTHRSIGSANNERLEYLGDSILNFVIATDLFKRFPKAKEGELTRMRATLVKGETTAVISQELKLGEYIQLGVGERKSGGFQRVSILADTLEAIIGAIYLDSNISVCRRCVLAWYQSRLNAIVPKLLEKDPKTQLQEYLQARHSPLPEYYVVQVSGDQHNPIFEVACKVSLLKNALTGFAGSRRLAEQNAAEAVLKELNHDK